MNANKLYARMEVQPSLQDAAGVEDGRAGLPTTTSRDRAFLKDGPP